MVFCTGRGERQDGYREGEDDEASIRRDYPGRLFEGRERGYVVLHWWSAASWARRMYVRTTNMSASCFDTLPWTPFESRS